MFILENFFYCKLFLKFSIYLLFFNLLLCLSLVFFIKYFHYSNFFRNFSIFTKIKTILPVFLLIDFFLFLISFLFYIESVFYYYSCNISSTIFIIPKINLFFYIKLPFLKLLAPFYLTLDFFSFLILFLSFLVGFITLVTLDTRLYWNNIVYLYFFNMFVLIVFFFVSFSNVLMFFLSYEFLLLPSFFFVFFVSPSRRAIQASFYFLMWTQIGSFIVLFAISYMVFISNSFDFFSLKNFNFSSNEIYFLYFIFFLGFGIKIPIWPFHYWITKTHVEAPSGFSIYLSGFLVKSALFGFYKLTNILNFYPNTSLFLTITCVGLIDASIKMWGQTDLKKLVAYCTIQEMNLIYLLFCFGDIYLKEIGFLFSLTHAFLSALMFFLVDCIYRRLHSRSVLQINGLSLFLPNLSIFIFIMCIFFSGLPGTLKFSIEFCIINNLIDFSAVLSIFLVVVANCLGLIGFSKNWFNALFGIRTSYFVYVQTDLSKKEILILLFILMFLFFFSFFQNFLL